jgi:hypothetical protein
MLNSLLPKLAGSLSPEQMRSLSQKLRRLRHPAWLGTIRRTTPLSDVWGFDRGTPVDRYYIDRFLEEHRADIHGRVLEVKDRTYTSRFGTEIERSDVLDIEARNPEATIIADLAAADSIGSDAFDCFVLTQTLQFIYDFRSAVHHAYRILCPGGVLLVTVPSLSRIAPRYGLESDYWRYTVASCRQVFGEVFGAEQVSVQSFGNVLTGISFLTGMAAEELSTDELVLNDEHFPVLIAIRCVKP